jgi:protein-L-isoaspartate(D-aspartate) O-methyltransferase
MMTDAKLQRINMVESQVRTSDVTDRRILKAMLEVPREAFVPEGLRAMAYMDDALPLTPVANGRQGRYLLPPRTLAKLIQLATVDTESLVLDVGCATGYSTAVLAAIAKKVVALESDGGLAAAAARTLRELAVANAEIVEGPLNLGVSSDGPYDAIMLNGAVADISQVLLDQLKDGGRLVAVVMEGPVCRARLWQRTGNVFDSRPAFEAGARALPGFERDVGFVF